MARDIYSFNWSRLRDAYGPATKVPDLLDAALNKSERAAVDALCDLSNRLCHQGVGVDNAAVPAMPVLAEVTERTEPDVRIMAVSMFADMAEASRILDMELPIRHLELGWTRLPPRPKELVEEVYSEVRDALLAELPRFLMLLDDPDDQVFEDAVRYLTAMDVEAAEAVYSEYAKRLHEDIGDQRRAQLITDMGYSAWPRARDTLFALSHDSLGRRARLARAGRLAYLLGQESPAELLDELEEAARDDEVLGWREVGGGFGVYPDLVFPLARARPELYEQLLERAVRLTPNAGLSAHYMLAFALCVGPRPEEFTPLQSAAIRAVGEQAFANNVVRANDAQALRCFHLPDKPGDYQCDTAPRFRSWWFGLW